MTSLLAWMFASTIERFYARFSASVWLIELCRCGISFVSAEATWLRSSANKDEITARAVEFWCFKLRWVLVLSILAEAIEMHDNKAAIAYPRRRNPQK